jgi:hypothetical protein
MGYYIQAPTNLGKAAWLVKTHGAERIPEPQTWRDDKVIICVVNNGPFEAMGFAYSPDELKEFKRPDARPPNRHREWLLMDLALAKKLSGYTR